MASLSFSVSGQTLDLSVTLQIADTDAPRILMYLMASPFGKVTENVISGNSQQWVTRPATPDEAAANYARNVLDSLLASTVAWEKAEAARAAAENIQPIVPTS